MTSVVAARIASASGSESLSAFCWSRNAAVDAADADRHGRRHRAHVAHDLLGLLAQRPPAGDEVDPVERPVGAACTRGAPTTPGTRPSRRA